MLSFRNTLRLLKRLFLFPSKTFCLLVSIYKINRLVRLKGVKVAFYDRYALHYTFSKPISDQFIDDGCSIFLIGDLEHPIRSETKYSSLVFYVPDGFEVFLRYLNIPLIVTPASDFDVSGKSKSTQVAHLFHSPVSMHYIYGDDSFDAYDIFFAVGPHHSKEIELLSKLRGWGNRKVYLAGYPKIDKIYNAFNDIYSIDMSDTNKKIMFAPSWGKKNILRSNGVDICRALLDAGFEVKLRPHKHSFVYDKDVLKHMSELFEGLLFEIDESMGFEVMLNSDLLVSDWSGVAYEYAFSTGKPVVFVNVEGEQKIQSIINKCIPLKPMEDVCRYEVGAVCQPKNVVSHVVSLLERDDSEWSNKISEVRGRYFYNFGCSAVKISKMIRGML